MKMYVVWYNPYIEGDRYISIHKSFEAARTVAMNDMYDGSDVIRIYEMEFGDTRYHRSEWIWECEADYHTGELVEIDRRKGAAS